MAYRQSSTTKAQRNLFFNLRSLKQGLGAMGMTDAKRSQSSSASSRRSNRNGNAALGSGRRFEPAGDDEESSFAPIAYLAAD